MYIMRTWLALWIFSTILVIQCTREIHVSSFSLTAPRLSTTRMPPCVVSPIRFSSRYSSPLQKQVMLLESNNNNMLSHPESSAGGTPSNRSYVNRSKVLQSVALLSVLGGLLLWKRETVGALWSVVTTSSNDWRRLVATGLDTLSAAGPVGWVGYAVAMMLWEMTVGITTPLETAAGMAFGVGPGILASGSGKFLGAWLAFLVARYRCAGAVRRRLGGNELLSLMEESVEETPFRVALLCRFSPLPELVKNAGMGILPVPKRWFVASLLVHGFSFTCLWTCMGAETGRVLRGLPPSSSLKMIMTGATWIGFGAPFCIGLWIKSLRDKQKQRRRREEQDKLEQKLIE